MLVLMLMLALAGLPWAGVLAETHSFPYCPLGCTGSTGASCLPDGRCSCSSAYGGLSCTSYQPGMTAQSSATSNSATSAISAGGEQYARAAAYDPSAGLVYVAARDYYSRDAVLALSASSSPPARAGGQPGALSAALAASPAGTAADPYWVPTLGQVCETLSATFAAALNTSCVPQAAYSAMWIYNGAALPSCATVSSGSACVAAAASTYRLFHPMASPDAWVASGYFGVFRSPSPLPAPSSPTAASLATGGVFAPLNLWRYKSVAGSYAYDFAWKVFYIPKLASTAGTLDSTSADWLTYAGSGYLQAAAADTSTGGHFSVNLSRALGRAGENERMS